MATKTQGIFNDMNYFLTFKESGGGFCNAYSDILKNLSDIYSNQVANGLHTEEEIDTFRETLPGTSAIFDHADMHDDLSFVQGYFKENVKVRMAAMSQESSKAI